MVDWAKTLVRQDPQGGTNEADWADILTTGKLPEGTQPVQAEIGGVTGTHLLQAGQEPTGASSGVFEGGRPVPGGAGAGGSFEAGVVPYMKRTVQNVPGSAVQLGKDMVTPLVHPVQTGKALGTLAMGTAEQVIPGKQKHEPAFDAMVSAVKDRYGNLENVLNTIKEDPVGFAADIASLITSAGTAVRGVGMAAKSGKVAKAGAKISEIGGKIEPVNVIREGLRQPTRIIPDVVPETMYRSSAKFSTTLPKAERERLTRTALKNDISPTGRGLDKSRQMIDDLNDTITKKIDTATEYGQQIPVENMFKDFDALKRNLMEVSGEPLRASKAFDSVKSEIRKANEKLGRTDLTPAEAQKMKQRIYRELEKEYARISVHPVKAEARMAVAKSLKEEIENLIPEVKKLNARESDLIALNKAIERSSSRISNRDVLGIGIPIKGAAGGSVAGPGGLISGLAIGLLDTPQVKAKLARVISNLKKKGIKIRPTPTLTRLGLVQAGRSEGIENDSNNP